MPEVEFAKSAENIDRGIREHGLTVGADGMARFDPSGMIRLVALVISVPVVDLDVGAADALAWFLMSGRLTATRLQERSMNKLNTAIFIFDGVEVLDFAGPFEVFSRTRLVAGVDSRRSDASAPFNVFTVARSGGPVHATGGLYVIPHFDFAGAPPIDLLVIPGASNTR